MDEMWSLASLRHDELISEEQVYLYDDRGELGRVTREDAIALARARGLHLIEEWPPVEGQPPDCFLGPLSLPLRWEPLEVPDAEPDPELWFEGSCGERDLFLTGQPHTFRGRMAAWCPLEAHGYNVSLSEMRSMSDATRYFVMGFLSGNEPSPPVDREGNTTPQDLEAWRAATARFRRTREWFRRWQTCSVCGAVLLPDRAAERCEAHEP